METIIALMIKILGSVAQDPLQGAKIRIKAMKRVFTLILLAFATTACLLSAPVKKKTIAQSSASKSTHKPVSSALRNTAAHSAVKSSNASVSKVRYVRGRNGKLVRVASGSRPAAPSYQLRPDAERYQQIQQALADKGYFKGEVNGQWGDDSVDALKRFQADQKLDNDGHLNSLTLIGLGLGPKHGGDIGMAGTAGLAAKPNPASPDPTGKD
jgi:hypothetical protein